MRRKSELDDRSYDSEGIPGPATTRPDLARGRRFQARLLAAPESLAPYLAADRAIASRIFFADTDVVPLPVARRFLAECDEVIAFEPARGGDPLGAVTVSGLDPQRRHCFISAFRFEATGSRFAFGGVLLAVDLLFTRWPVRRVRFDVMAFNLPQFALATAHADAEGVRRDWIERDGRSWDAHLFSLSRSRWEHDIRPYLRRWV